MARTGTRSENQEPGPDLDADAIKAANKMPRPGGGKRCYACLKGPTTRCLRKSDGATGFCKGHARWSSRLQAGDQEYSRFIDSDDEEGGGDEELPDSGRKKKKTKKKKKQKKKKQVAFDHDERGGEEEMETYLAKPLPAPKTSSPRFDGVVPLGALDPLIYMNLSAPRVRFPRPAWSLYLMRLTRPAPPLLGQHFLRIWSPTSRLFGLRSSRTYFPPTTPNSSLR